MEDLMTTVDAAPRKAAQDAANPRRWVVWLARAGYGGRGLVYAVIGGIALAAAVGQGQAEGSRGAPLSLTDEPGGTWVLAFLAVGLVGYSLWRVIQAILDADGDDTGGRP